MIDPAKARSLLRTLGRTLAIVIGIASGQNSGANSNAPGPDLSARDILEQRVQRVRGLIEEIRLEGKDSKHVTKRILLAQWGNWGNWPNWPNWNNWQNWGNWGNWGNWPNG